MSQGLKNGAGNKEDLGMQEWKKKGNLIVLPSPHVVTINKFQVLLSSIICLPSYPIGRRYLPYSSPTQYKRLIKSAWPTRPLSCSLYPGCKNGLRTPVQCWLSLGLAHCVHSISHSNKLYFSLILSHVWKFFSNPHTNKMQILTSTRQ